MSADETCESHVAGDNNLQRIGKTIIISKDVPEGLITGQVQRLITSDQQWRVRRCPEVNGRWLISGKRGVAEWSGVRRHVEIGCRHISQCREVGVILPVLKEHLKDFISQLGAFP